jgi:hypothetical protein
MAARPLLGCAVVAAAALGCTRGPTQRPPGPITSALFALAAELGADAEATTRAFASLQDIALRVEKRHARSHADVADDINAVIFGELGFAREIDSPATRFFQLSSVIRCLGESNGAFRRRRTLPPTGLAANPGLARRTRGLAKGREGGVRSKHLERGGREALERRTV